MSYSDLRAFVADLERRGLLNRIEADISSDM